MQFGWLLSAVAWACTSTGSYAQTPPAVLSVDASLTATDNSNQAPAGLEQKDLIASIRPMVTLARRTAGLSLDLEAAVTLLGYAKGTQDNVALPDARATLKATLVERWLYLDAAALVAQVENDPYGPKVDGVNSANTRTATTFRLSPYLERELTANTSILARYDASVTDDNSGSGNQLVSLNSLLRIERKPVPLGGSLELSRLKNESTGIVSNTYQLDTARVRGSVKVNDQLVLGVVAGSDRSQWFLTDNTDPLYGVTVQWSPGPRTELSADLEHRFFGAAGRLQFNHRMPRMSFALTLSRQPVMATTTLGVLGPGSDVRAFLDSILTTRYPDPTARGGVVDQLVKSRGIDTRLSGPTDVIAEYPQAATRANATWVILGPRNTASFTLFAQTLRVLTRENDPLPVEGVVGQDSQQAGGSFDFNHRLTPQLSADAGASWSRFEGLGSREGEVTDQVTYRLSLVRNLAPRTGASAGIRYTRLSTNAAGQNDFDETQAFVGINHRF